MSSNIKVGIRVRPLICREKSEKLKEQWEINENSMHPIDVVSGKRNGDIYYFDHIFDSTYCNADIYNTIVHPVVHQAMNGFNGTIFAYGQTSSGKTYTMMGDANEDGLISIAVQNIFLAIEQSINRKFLLRVSYMEIYNEKIYDLLEIKNTVKISEDYSGSVIVNVKEEVTDCAEKVYDIMKKGDKARRIGETNMNEKSSRSHTIFRIIIESSDLSDTGVVNVAHLNLVDLAGSERATLTKATGQRLKEGSHINKSLSTLSLVMKQLSESQDYINFRDSKLTRILQPSLGGNALTAIICAVTPAALEETHSTLAFASRAKTVKNKPLLNEVVTDEALIHRYTLEINKLKRDLEKANDNRTLQAQKITLLEKCILFSKKTNNSNKNRRKTWSGPNDPNRTLPVIYETDVLRDSDRLSLGKFDILESEEFPFDDYPLYTDKSAPSSEKKLLPSCISSRSDTFNLVDSIYTSSINGQPVKKSEDIVKWLINSTETPKSVLRERAEYYEHEFVSLKELTTKEKLLLTTDSNTEMESLQTELVNIKSELECEKRIKKEQEAKFNEEMKVLQSKFDEMKIEKDKLSKIVKKVEKDNEQKNDYEFLVEMYKEKYKKREKELLDSLQEARELLKSSTNNTDDEKNQIISTDVSISVEMKVFLEDCKNQINILKSELESQKPMSVVQKMFDEIKKANEEMLINSTDCSDDVQDLLNVFKYMFDLNSIMLADDTVILELEKEKRQLQNREKTFQLLVSKQDEEIKHLSENILQYMNELAFHKSETEKYKDIAKLETSLQTELDFSIMTTDTKNMTDYDLNNSTHNQSAVILKSEQYIQTEEDFTVLMRSKDKEIEDLSDKIMEYIEQITSLEQELNKLKSVSNADQLTETNIVQNYSGCKDDEIEDLKSKIQEYVNQISIHEEQLSNYRANIDAEKNLIKDKDDDITQLTTTINTYEVKMNKYISNLQSKMDEIKEKDKEIEDLSDNIMNYLSEITNLKDEIQLMNVQLQSEKDLIKTKDEDVINLSNKINIYVNQLSTAEEEIRNLKIASNTQDLIEIKDKEIIDLTEKITSYSDQLKAVLEEFEKYKSDFQAEKNLIDMKNKEIEELQTRLSDNKEELQRFQSEIIFEKNLNESKDKQIIELTTQAVAINEQLLSIQEELRTSTIAEKDSIKAKDEEIAELTEKIKSYSKQLFDLENYESVIEAKNYEIEEKNINIKALTAQLTEYDIKLTSAEKELKRFKTNVEELNGIQEINVKEQLELETSAVVENDIIEPNNKAVEELKSNIINYENQLSTAEAKLKEYEYDLKIQKDLTESKIQKINELSSNIADYINQLSTAEDNLIKYETDLKIQKEVNNSKNKEIEELSSNIINYRNQLSIAKKELHQYKSNLQSETNLIQLKDQEIEELSTQIMDYIDQLSALEMKLNKYKTSEETENDQIISKNKELQELTSRIVDYESQLISAQETVKKYKSEIEEKTELLYSKNNEIEDLTEKLIISENQKSEFTELKEQKELEIQEFNVRILDYSKKIKQYQEEIEIIKLININSERATSENLKMKQNLEDAYKTVKELKGNLSQIRAIEELFSKSKLDLEKTQELLQLKETENNELSEKIRLYTNLVSSKEEEFAKYESQLKKDENLIKLKDDEIKNATEQLIKYTNQIFERDEVINKYMRNLEDEKYINKMTDERIQNLTEEHSNQIAEFKEQINNLKSTLNEKNGIIVHRENNIKSLNDIISQHIKQSQEAEVWSIKLSQVCSEYEMLKIKFKAEESKSLEYFIKINTLEQQLASFNDQANQMKKEFELVQNNNLQYTSKIEILQKQICALQGQLIEQECTLKQNKDYTKQLETEKNKILENITLLRHASETEIQKATDKLREQSKYIENLQNEIVTLQSMGQNSNTELIQEMARLKKKNDDYKKIVEKVTGKANSKISSYYENILKLKQDKELLRVTSESEKSTIQTLQKQLVGLHEKIQKRSANDEAKFQAKINDLEATNEKLIKVIDDYQEQMHMKGDELTSMKKKLESMKYENLNLHKMTRDLNDKLCETEVLLKSCKTNVQLLEKEKENYNETSRVLEESLEDAKFELYELKNKEREKIKKVKRQSLHDSSRSLSSDEQLTINDENQQMHLKSFDSSNDETKSNESERSVQRMPLSDRKIDEHRNTVSKLQNENEKLRKKCDQVTNLCRIRKNKIDELERQVQSYRTQ